MPDLMTTASRFSRGPFFLDESRFTRLVDVAGTRTDELDCDWTSSYRIRLQNGKHLTVTDQDDVIRLDNTVANPIQELEVTFVGKDEGSVVAQAEIEFDGGHFPGVGVKVRAEDARWAQRVQAELDEQVERSRQSGLIWRIGATPSRLLVLLILMVLVLPLAVLATLSDLQRGIPAAERSTLVEEGRAARTDSERLAFLVESRLVELETSPPVGFLSPDWLFRWQTGFILIPLLLSTGLAIYAVWNCYPRAVFAWGDMKEAYDSIVARRRIIWTVCILSLVVGVFGNLAGAAIVSLVT